MISARDLYQSVGVNVHTLNAGTPETDGIATGVVPVLIALGVRHVRAQLVPTDDWRFSQWGSAALKAFASTNIRLCTMLPDPKLEGESDVAWPTRLFDLLESYGLHDLVDVWEGDNEPPDPVSLAGWYWTLKQELKSYPLLSQRVLGPVMPDDLSVVQRFKAAYPLSDPLTLADTHPYSAGKSQTFSNLDWQQAKADAYLLKSGLPMMATEFGFSCCPSTIGDDFPTTEADAAEYTVRALIMHKLHGIQRTYVYQLHDNWPNYPQTGQAYYGLFKWANGKPWQPRLSALAIRNFLSIVGDADTPLMPQPFVPSIAGATDALHALPVQTSRSVQLWVTREVLSGAASQTLTLMRQGLPNFTNARICYPAASCSLGGQGSDTPGVAQPKWFALSPNSTSVQFALGDRCAVIELT